MRLAIILSFFLLLVGCETTQVVDDQVVLHPNLPRPVSGLQIEWDVIEYSDKIYVATTYEEFLDYLQYNQDIVRYINQLNKTLCFYRSDLNDAICVGQSESE